MDSAPKQPDDFQLVQGIKQRIMGFLVCIIPGEQTEHGLDAVTPLHTSGAVAVGTGGDFGVVLAVGGKAHDVVPSKASQLRQVIAVEAGVVGKDGVDVVLPEPGT